MKCVAAKEWVREEEENKDALERKEGCTKSWGSAKLSQSNLNTPISTTMICIYT